MYIIYITNNLKIQNPLPGGLEKSTKAVRETGVSLGIVGGPIKDPLKPPNKILLGLLEEFEGCPK